MVGGAIIPPCRVLPAYSESSQRGLSSPMPRVQCRIASLLVSVTQGSIVFVILMPILRRNASNASSDIIGKCSSLSVISLFSGFMVYSLNSSSDKNRNISPIYIAHSRYLPAWALLSASRFTFPAGVFGSSSTKAIALGYSCALNLVFIKSLISSSKPSPLLRPTRKALTI